MVRSLSDVRIFDHVAIAPTPSEIDRCRESYAAAAPDAIRMIALATANFYIHIGLFLKANF